MSKENYTHIIGIIDRSGSMGSIKKDMEGGFNSFVADQAEVGGEATLTLAQFDSDYELVYANVGLEDVEPFTLQPRGSTALLDAIGLTLNTERDRILEMDEDEQPEKVVCVIITDGHENSSTEYNRPKVMEMIEDLEDEEDIQWDFVFLGANQDAIAEGGSMGVRANSSLNYEATSVGTQEAFSTLTRSMTRYRSAAPGTEYFISEEDKVNKAIPSELTDLVDEE